MASSKQQNVANTIDSESIQAPTVLSMVKSTICGKHKRHQRDHPPGRLGAGGIIIFSALSYFSTQFKACSHLTSAVMIRPVIQL